MSPIAYVAMQQRCRGPPAGRNCPSPPLVNNEGPQPKEVFMAYTTEGVLSQVYLAFGQGTGAVRVSQDACQALHDRYLPRIDAALVARWETEAVQVLERIRAI